MGFGDNRRNMDKEKARSVGGPNTIDTLGALIDDGYTVTAYCACGHSGRVDLGRLAALLGRDFGHIGWPDELRAKLRCAKCGRVPGEFIVGAPNVPTPGLGLYGKNL